MLGNGYGAGAMWGFGLLVLIGVGLLVVLAVQVLGGGISRGTGASTRTRPPREPGEGPRGRGRAHEVLDQRYARGELSTEEYRERVQGLGDDS